MRAAIELAIIIAGIVALATLGVGPVLVDLYFPAATAKDH